MNINNILFCIFSYNRGVYLKGCVESIIRHCPNLEKKNIIIYDDGSEEVNTVSILKELQKDIKIEIGKQQSEAISRSGLYNNMNLAFSYAKDSGYEYVFFIQEDFQFIRDIDDEFLDECERIFNSDSNIIEIQPIFFKGTSTKNEYDKFTKINKQYGYYYGNKDNLLGVADTGLIHVDRLKKVDWFFDNQEVINMKKGTELGFMYVKSKNPIMMYTPWPETYRYREFSGKNMFTRILDKYYKAGYHPYKSLSINQVEKLINRDINIYPIAEDFLTIQEDIKLKKPWNFVSVKFYVLKKIFNLLKKLKLLWIIKCFYCLKKKQKIK